jgi:uncharacterized protein YgbK (DUF1537 family)
MLLGCIADDFTGASDLANSLAKEGMRTVQFVGTPRGPVDAPCDAGVIALKTRSIEPAEAVRQSMAALDWLRRQGCRQFLFKYCSTFDSTPQGNIGPVAEALMDALNAPAAVVCPAFPATGRTLFMGHLFVKDRLLNESGMQDHPLTPMTDADIPRWLRRQTKGDVGLVPYQTVMQGPVAIRDAIANEAAAGRRLVVVDAISEKDLRVIGAAIRDHPLVTGGSGIALGLPQNFREQALLSSAKESFSPAPGPGVILSGSCSSATRAQVASHLRSHPGFKVDADSLITGRVSVADALTFIKERLNDMPMIYSTADPDTIAATQSLHGREVASRAVEEFFAEMARQMVAVGVTRIVVGGGETAGSVVTALGISHFNIGEEIDPGVPALEAKGVAPLRLALKSGNFGGTDFYARALRALETA